MPRAQQSNACSKNTIVLLFFLLFFYSAQRKRIGLVRMKQGQVLPVKMEHDIVTDSEQQQIR